MKRFLSVFLIPLLLLVGLLAGCSGCGTKTADPVVLTNAALTEADAAYRASYDLIQSLDRAGVIKAESKPGIQRAMTAAQASLDTADYAFLAYLEARTATGDVTGVQAVITILEGSQASLMQVLALAKDSMTPDEYTRTVALVSVGYKASLTILKAFLVQPAATPVVGPGKTTSGLWRHWQPRTA